MKNYVITIARGLGSGGSHIAKRLAKELNIPYYDEEILQMAADLSGINETYFLEANEKINKGKITINNSKGVYNANKMYHVGDKMYLSNENLFNYQAMVIKNLALEGTTSCIIVGKAANYILRSLVNVVRVNVQAPEEYCINSIRKRTEKNENEAREMIRTTDQYRRNYYKYYTGREWNDVKEYDININTAAYGEEYSVEMIKQYLKTKNIIE